MDVARPYVPGRAAVEDDDRATVAPEGERAGQTGGARADDANVSDLERRRILHGRAQARGVPCLAGIGSTGVAERLHSEGRTRTPTKTYVNDARRRSQALQAADGAPSSSSVCLNNSGY